MFVCQKSKKSVMKHHYQDNPFAQETSQHCIAKPHLSHLWLYLHSLRSAQSLFDHAIVLQHMMHYNIPWRERQTSQQMSKERDTESG